MQDKGAKTEKPTAKKLRDTRKKGNVARSNELSGALVLLGFLAYFHLFGADWLIQLRQFMTRMLSADLFRTEFTVPQLMVVNHTVCVALGHLLLLPVLCLAGASMIGNLLQGAPTATLQPLSPDWSKLNPFKGIRKVFKLKGWVDLSKAMFKVSLFTMITYSAVRDAVENGIGRSPGIEGTFQAIVDLGSSVMLRVGMLMIALAVIDVLYTRWDYRRNLKMTKEEIKEEHKQMEGDQHVKSKIRSKQIELSRSRMMADVPDATVVVTNPTHFAVALQYLPGETGVPRVLAKGADLLARRIREIAEEHRIPIHRDPPLARALFRSVEVGDFIPETLFRAVAEVLALVLRRRRPAAGAPGEVHA